MFEAIRSPLLRPLKAAFFDYDGTISLIVDGWQELFLDIFRETLNRMPGGNSVSESRIREIIDHNNGKQSLAQAESLAEEVRKLGGTPLAPQVYLDDYFDRLNKLSQPRIAEVKAGNRNKYLVPGVCDLLATLKKHGIVICLASGSPENVVRDGLDMFGLTEYFDGGIHGVRLGRNDFCKADILDRFLKRHGFQGDEVVGFGDGVAEIGDVHNVGGLAVGIVRIESPNGPRNSLIEAGADWIISDYIDLPLHSLFVEKPSLA